MARTATVTLGTVIRNAPKRYVITLHLSYHDGTTIYFEKDYSQEYLYGETPALYNAKWILAMQSDIDDYKAAEAIATNALLTTAINTIQAGLVV